MQRDCLEVAVTVCMMNSVKLYRQRKHYVYGQGYQGSFHVSVKCEHEAQQTVVAHMLGGRREHHLLHLSMLRCNVLAEKRQHACS